jgi:hypothetical protein
MSEAETVHCPADNVLFLVIETKVYRAFPKPVSES